MQGIHRALRRLVGAMRKASRYLATVRRAQSMPCSFSMSESWLSDSQISDLLKEQGIECARRTVAKYREALRIAPANLRKAL